MSRASSSGGSGGAGGSGGGLACGFARLFACAALAGTLAGCLEPGEPHLAYLDTEPPQLVQTVPEEGAILEREGELLLTFSEQMDPRSLVAGIWLLSGGERLIVGIEVPPEPTDTPQAIQQQRPQPYPVRVKWSAPLPEATSVTLVLDTVLTDEAGNHLAASDGGSEQLRLTYRTP